MNFENIFLSLAFLFLILGTGTRYTNFNEPKKHNIIKKAITNSPTETKC